MNRSKAIEKAASLWGDTHRIPIVRRSTGRTAAKGHEFMVGYQEWSKNGGYYDVQMGTGSSWEKAFENAMLRGVK